MARGSIGIAKKAPAKKAKAPAPPTLRGFVNNRSSASTHYEKKAPPKKKGAR